MQSISKKQLKTWFTSQTTDLRELIRLSPSTPKLLEDIRREVPNVSDVPQLTYTLYREFEHIGQRPGYQYPYYLKRARLTRAVLELLMGDDSMVDRVHDLAWSICEETSWVLPAHEEQGPDYWEINPPWVRTKPFGAHTALTREPDAIDLFAAETGAMLAETVHLVGDRLAPEVRQRIRQEVERHIFKPYLAYARRHWWFKGALNWNGVCNGSIGLAFLYLENDLETLVEALELVLEGFETYIATGFEADGGSIEGVGYWNYGLMYYVIVAEMLREKTGGELDLLADPRLKTIAAYPPGMALTDDGDYINFGDATPEIRLAGGIINRIADRTGDEQLRALLASCRNYNMYDYAKLPVTMRHAAWWDQTQPIPELVQRDFYLPETAVIKFVGQTADQKTVLMATQAGHNDGHHSHTDVATFIVNIDGESLMSEAGRGLYSKDYFRQGRYKNIFNNSYTHNVPRIGGSLQAPGPEFGGHKQFYGTIIDHGQRDNKKFAVIDFHTAYDRLDLRLARRTLSLDANSGEVMLADTFEFAGAPLEIEEAFSTWFPVEVQGSRARIQGERSTLELNILEPEGVVFATESLEEACRENQLEGILTRLSVTLPPGSTHFRMQLIPR